MTDDKLKIPSGMKQNSFYITTTLPYVNADLHMGHALEFVRADAIARYKKLRGFDVFLNTGTDEHGMKIYEKALSLKKTPQAFVDESFTNFKEAVKIFGMDEEILHFVRTTDEHHIRAAQEFWKRVKDNGYIYKKYYEAKYCVGCEAEKTDSELDENGECPLHPGRPLELIKEENYFFKFSEFGDKLLDFYNKNPGFVVPDFRLNEMKNFIKNGLQDFSISRLKEKMPWGIPVPGDDTQVMYVWFDALVNYISALGWPDNLENFQKYWLNGNPTQYCGKDNTRFQAVMWQAMLMAAGLPNSHQIIVNGFITGDKGIRMSKTIGNVVDPREIAKEYGTDALRYFLLREISSFEDSPFTVERFKEAYNANLANGLGNLVSRVMTLSSKNINNSERIIELVIEDAKAIGLSRFITDAFDKFDLKLMCDLVWVGISRLDKKISEDEPFKLFKSETEKAVKLFISKEAETKIENGKEVEVKKWIGYLWDLAVIAYELEPLMPETSRKIIETMKANKKPEQPLFLRKE